MRILCLLHPFQFRENCGEHYDEAKMPPIILETGSAIKTPFGPMFRHKAGYKSGHHNDDFTQYGEKDGIFLLVEGFENCLTHILQQHEDKCSKISFMAGTVSVIRA